MYLWKAKEMALQRSVLPLLTRIRNGEEGQHFCFMLPSQLQSRAKEEAVLAARTSMVNPGVKPLLTRGLLETPIPLQQ